jgi:hypothetical protein
METLQYPAILKDNFPDWAEGLKKAIMSAAEKEKVDYDGRQYWWSQYGGKKQYNRSVAGTGKAGSGKPQGTTVYIPVSVRVVRADDIIKELAAPTEKGIYKRVIFTDRHPENKKHEFVVEVYKLAKVFPAYESAKDDKKEEKKEEQKPVEGADEL